MGSTCSTLLHNTDTQFTNFERKNQYRSKQGLEEEKEKIKKYLAPNSNNRYDTIISFIAHLPNQYFIDQNFKCLEICQNFTSQSLNKMYNFKRRELKFVYKNQNTPLEIFDQKQVQFCYLTTVFYHICLNRALKQQIFITKQPNKYNAYIIHLMCNGKNCNVIVDDTIPTYNNHIKYLNIQPTQQIWPFLLEKAWCKQIGRYDKAKGLSPEDCFQQITGIPTTSFSLRENNFQNNFKRIHSEKNSGFWVTLIGIINISKGLRSRQVFYLEAINSQKCVIRSPYTDFEMFDKKVEKGSIQLSKQQVLQNFEYVTIGYYKQNYITTSLSYQSQKNKQVIYQVRIKKKGGFNIRFSQFYHQYLLEPQHYYKYSSVLIQLYNEKKQLMEGCQGREQNIQGIRSSNVFEQIIKYLIPGLYYLRVQVNWTIEQIIHEGAIVCYSQPNALQIYRTEQDEMNLLSELLVGTFSYKQPEQIKNQMQNIKVRHSEKYYGQVLGIQNLNNEGVTLELIFKDSQNIKINHFNLVDNVVEINLNEKEERILEILPKNPNKAYYLAPFDIKKK